MEMGMKVKVMTVAEGRGGWLHHMLSAATRVEGWRGGTRQTSQGTTSRATSRNDSC